MQCLPFSEALYGFITIVASIPVILLVAAVDGVSPDWIWLCIFPLWALFFVISYCLGLILGLLIVYFKDLRQILSLSLQVWFYATPILYSRAMIPEKFQWIIKVNPIGSLFASFHDVIVYQQFPSNETLINLGLWSLGIFASAYLLWLKLRYRIAEDL